MEEDDLEYQLRCEAQEKLKKSAEQPLAGSLAEASGTYVDPQDGTVYEWNKEKKAWFPKIDTDFIAMYQANYGSYDATQSTGSSLPSVPRKPVVIAEADDISDEVLEEHRPISSSRAAAKKKQKKTTEGFGTVQKAEERAKRKAQQEPAAWFEVDDEHNRNVYVSNLPTEMTPEGFVELMSKCGIVMKDPRNDAYKVKLYKDEEGKFKGDALCTYLKIESVPLALQILDGYRVENKEIRVERAKFNLKGSFDPEKAKQKRLKKNEKKRLLKAEARLLGWKPDKLPGTRPKHEKVVVIKNMFDPKEFEMDPALILEFKKDLQTECQKFGDVKKVIIYDRHPEGIATVGFADFEHADACIAKMNGRWFDQRQLEATHWDGVSKFKVDESAEEEQKRLGEWEKFLNEGSERSASFLSV